MLIVDFCGRGDWDPFLFHSILLMAGNAVVVALSARRNGGKWAKFMRKFLWANDDADFSLESVSALLRFGVESRLPFLGPMVARFVDWRLLVSWAGRVYYLPI